MLTPQKNVSWTPMSWSPAVAMTEAKENDRLSKEEAKDKAAALPAPMTESFEAFEPLAVKASRLEQELDDYQYNMSLLLDEKNELQENNEALQDEVAEARAMFECEQSARLTAMSEVEKLEEALHHKDQHLVNIEESRDELEEAKAKANSLMAQLGHEREEMEEKLHLAHLRVAEADRKMNGFDMKSQKLQARESSLVVQRQILDAEIVSFETRLEKQKEELMIWERKLEEREERVHEQRRTVEDKLREVGMRLEQREYDIDQLQKKIDVDTYTLKQREDDVSKRLNVLASKEKEVEKWLHRNELLAKEKEGLSEETRKVERDWEVLDEKRAALESDVKKFDEEKERFERFRCLEEEKLKEKQESIRLEKESFDAKMKHEELAHARMVQELEQQRRELDASKARGKGSWIKKMFGISSIKKTRVEVRGDESKLGQNLSANKAEASEDPSLVNALKSVDTKEETGSEESEQSSLSSGHKRTRAESSGAKEVDTDNDDDKVIGGDGGCKKRKETVASAMA